MVPQRPQRPTTRVPQPAAGKSPTARQPTVRPPTQRIHSAPTTRMPTESSRGTSRGRYGTGRAGAAKSSLPLVLGASAGAFVLILIIAVAASGGTKKAPPASNPKGPKVMDVAGMEEEGKRKCEEGVYAVQRAYDRADKAGLQRGVQLITEGNQLLDKAYQASGHMYDTKKYNETLKMARGKLLELK